MTNPRRPDDDVTHSEMGLADLFAERSAPPPQMPVPASAPDPGSAAPQDKAAKAGIRWTLQKDHVLLLAGSGLALGAVLLAASATHNTGPFPSTAAADPAPAPTPTYNPVPVAHEVEVVRTPFRPAQVIVESLGIVAPVAPVGTRSDGQMEIPEDPSIVGWWEGSSLADDTQGNMVLAGHVYNAEWGPGIFSRLEGAKPGDQVEVRAGDGTVAEYVVTSVERPPKTEFPASRVFAFEGPHQIVLATCGNYNPATSHYEDNILVYASIAS